MGHLLFIILHVIATLFGFVFLIITIPLHLIYAAVGKKNKSDLAQSRQCPYCAELIKKEAIVCKHCGKDLDKAESPPKQSGVAVKQPKPVLLIILIVIFGLTVYVLNNTKSAKSKTTQADRIVEKAKEIAKQQADIINDDKIDASSFKSKTDLDKAKELMDKDCADFAEMITYSSLQKETGMSRSHLLMNYTINLWEKSNAKGKGKVVGEINPGAHALVLESGKDSYKIFIPIAEHIGWVSKIQVERTMRLNPGAGEDCSSN